MESPALLIRQGLSAALHLTRAHLGQSVGGRGATHDCVARSGPGKEKAWIVGLAAHGVMSRAKAAAEDDSNLGNDTGAHG